MSTPPIPADYLQFHGPWRTHTYPQGVTVGPNPCCPVRGCTVGPTGMFVLLRVLGPDAEIWFHPCREHLPSVVSLGEAWRQTKHAHKGYGWRPVPRMEATPPVWADDCVVTDAAGLIIHGRHPLSGVMHTRPEHPAWPAVVALLGAGIQLDLFAPEVALW